jgi:hypothetical protein
MARKDMRQDDLHPPPRTVEDVPGHDALVGGLEVWPQLDPFAATVRWQLLQLGQLVQRSVDRVAAANGLSHAEVAILGALKRFGPPFEASPSQLQGAHWVTLPGLTSRSPGWRPWATSRDAPIPTIVAA